MPRLARSWTLGPSPIHGIGVFAARDIDPGARLGRVHTLPLGDIDRFATLPATAMLILGGERFTVHAAVAGFPFWYLNYSRSANVKVGGKSEIVATRLILKGDELTMPFVGADGHGR